MLILKKINRKNEWITDMSEKKPKLIIRKKEKGKEEWRLDGGINTEKRLYKE